MPIVNIVITREGSTPDRSAATAEEKAAMRARAKELKAAVEGEEAIVAALKKMSPADRAIGKRIHELVKEAAPDLTPKTWYGMPAYANADDKIVVFFQDSGKFNYRYSTLGFQDTANLDDGDLWPVSYAIRSWSSSVEEKVVALVKAAVS